MLGQLVSMVGRKGMTRYKVVGPRGNVTLPRGDELGVNVGHKRTCIRSGNDFITAEV